MSIDGVGRVAGSYGLPAIAPREGGPRPEPGSEPDARADVRSVLTPDELAYFAELEKMGPLTYGPRAASRDLSPAPRGQRVDVRA